MTRHTLLAALILLTLATTSSAFGQELASTAPAPKLRPSVGARVGGYGFRQLNTDTNLINWEQCRMNGVGVFGNLDLGTHAYTELSLDFYHAIAAPMAQGLDRLSFHTLGLIGYRMMPDWWITPHVQLGGGVEWTRVDIFGQQDSRLAPVGFVGLGGEINLGKFHFGSTIRSNIMQLPVYDWNNRFDGDPAAKAITYETELAAQMIFTVRYSM